MSSNHASLDAAAVERKARLAKLASLKRKQPPTDGDESSGRTDTSPPDVAVFSDTSKYLSGRNYDATVRGPKLGFENAPSDGRPTLEDRAESLAQAAREQEQQEQKEEKPLDLFKLQPKKPNWDLKRDLAKKMDVLDQRTDNAIARMVRERIEDQKRKERDKLNGDLQNGDGESVGIAGVDLVEGVKVREREEEEEERREREDEDSEEV
ncbi:uncharacterized protein KY384_006981 [Bacidia gigantensis]|uniref:uncharacterized protein n=1 Tax=Bacidia gigantensis TaxID=2732470 RepID=UPI001D043E72|nr:uncharacterized protein KY384_006981 [Bacidia gigantensis]KAG8528065.1 hypothetical protein KY384_006981 [Bacidia gigantensis]